jgi:hypothetical protein
MQVGMITSIEPGTYRPGRWGVRIENLAMNREAGSSEFGEFLKFETLTLCPIDTRCLEVSLLTRGRKTVVQQLPRRSARALESVARRRGAGVVGYSHGGHLTG